MVHQCAASCFPGRKDLPPFFPVTAFGTGVPAVGEMQTAKHRSAVQAACSALHRSSWLSMDAGQQLHLPVEIWDETKCSTVLKDARHLFIPLWLNLWGLNSANWCVSQFYTENLSCWESSTLQSAALKGLLWEASSLEMWWCEGVCVLLLVSCFSGSSGFCCCCSFAGFLLEEISSLISLMTKFRKHFSVTVTALKCWAISLRSFHVLPRVSTFPMCKWWETTCGCFYMWLVLFSHAVFRILIPCFPLLNLEIRL